MSGRPPFSQASRDLLRETVLDAAGEAMRDRSWGDISMAAIAERAGVSRQTLYNSFGSREELARAYVSREAETFIDAVETAVAANAPNARAALAAALELFLGAAQTHPLVRAISAPEAENELLPLVTTRGGPLMAEVNARLAGVILESWPHLRHRDAALVADTLARLAISHAALPGGTVRSTASAIASVLGPYVDGLTLEAATAA